MRLFLGQYNLDTCQEAMRAMATGDACKLGALMCEFQREFDRCAMPMCPSQLRAPKLHTVLACEALQPLIWGGKGIGSQGDGTVQLLCKSESTMYEVISKLEAAMDVTCMPLILPATKSD